MNRRIQQSVAILLAVALMTVAVAGSASAENLLYKDEPTGGAMVADFIFVRPFAIVGLGISAVTYALSYPFAYWGKNTEQAKQKLVVDPYEYAFKRPLGDF